MAPVTEQLDPQFCLMHKSGAHSNLQFSKYRFVVNTSWISSFKLRLSLIRNVLRIMQTRQLEPGLVVQRDLAHW